jgi:uncharacterized protein YdhG (YjbR/CyaY superfamily)
MKAVFSICAIVYIVFSGGMNMPMSGPTFQSIDDYIGKAQPELQSSLAQLREVIREAAPGATEKISYGMPTFYLHGNLVHFAAYPKHIGFYPAPSGIEAFKSELARYKWAKGSVQFPLDQELPYDLIARITRYRVEENTKSAASASRNPAAKKTDR